MHGSGLQEESVEYGVSMPSLLELQKWLISILVILRSSHPNHMSPTLAMDR